MLPATVTEQQAKLGVSAEESKALRLKRQQARFRDRGGAFVPATSNPLVDILLARTVSGESPSKAHPKDGAAKRLSLAKARQASPMRNARAGTQAVAESSKSRQPAPKKRKAKAVEPDADSLAKPPPKRRGTARAKKKTPGPGSDTETLRPSTSNGNGKGHGNAKTKTKPKPKAKSKAGSNLPKVVVEVLVSDDDSTLVEVPRQVKSKSTRQIRIEDEQSDDDAPIVKKRAKPRVVNSKASSATRAKTKGTTGAPSSKEKLPKDDEAIREDDRRPKTIAKKRQILPDEEEDVAEPPAKKGKAASSTSAKPKTPIEPESAPRPTKDVTKRNNSKAMDKGKGKIRAEPIQDDVAGPVERDGDERPLDRVSKPEKRKTEDNHDDRPRKVVKFSETGPPHSSSQKLKENQSERKRKDAAKSSAKDELDAPREKLATKPPSCRKPPKGPPQEVLERIKASATRHLRCVDSEPDELDCLS